MADQDSTRAVHSDRELNETHSVAPPIFQASTFFADSAEEFLRSATEPRHPGFYTRYANPTHQQAEAVIAARTKIVQGAVGMVELALNGLAERQLLQLDDERRAAMVSNLLVVLCSDHDATPVINAGTLYA